MVVKKLGDIFHKLQLYRLEESMNRATRELNINKHHFISSYNRTKEALSDMFKNNRQRKYIPAGFFIGYVAGASIPRDKHIVLVGKDVQALKEGLSAVSSNVDVIHIYRPEDVMTLKLKNEPYVVLEWGYLGDSALKTVNYMKRSGIMGIPAVLFASRHGLRRLRSLYGVPVHRVSLYTIAELELIRKHTNPARQDEGLALIVSAKEGAKHGAQTGNRSKERY